MKTITFYSYKGGSGRSLALANAARYLARLDYKVVAIDFDLEAPGLHYKFASPVDEKPLCVSLGVVDFLHSFVVQGVLPSSLSQFTVDVPVPGIDKPLVHLIPAGRAPSKEYWEKLARINWHDLFYEKDAQGVQLFLELKNRVLDELAPDFLLIDSRTGITEMGGVAATLLADMVICFVLPTRENLEGARTVLRSIKHSLRETGRDATELLVALSRLPQITEPDKEGEITAIIRNILNEEADDLRDTLNCSDIYVLHSESALEVRESLRIGSGTSPDESILLRDYLRLFASVVPKDLIKSKVQMIVEQARDKIWEDPDGAVKEVEELAESFGHPELYRSLLSFYEVRNASTDLVMKRAKRLWELTGDSSEPLLWKIVKKFVESFPLRIMRRDNDWPGMLSFMEAVWRAAGNNDQQVGMRLADGYSLADLDSHAADLLLEMMRESEPNAKLASRCIQILGYASRAADATVLIEDLKKRLSGEPEFLEAWAQHALRVPNKESLMELGQPPMIDILRRHNLYLSARIYRQLGNLAEANVAAETLLREAIREEPPNRESLREAGMLFSDLGRWEEFEAFVEDKLPPHWLMEIRDRIGMTKRQVPRAFIE